MVKKGEWVRIHSVVLKAAERTGKIPEDTQKCDLEMWTKGTLLEDAKIGDTVKEYAKNKDDKDFHHRGGLVSLEEGPYYTHSYGKFVPEIIEIDKQLREIMGGNK